MPLSNLRKLASFFLMLGCLSSCLQLQHGVPPAQAQAPESGASGTETGPLDFGFYLSGSDPEVPDLEQALPGGYSDSIVSDGTIQLTKRIPLPQTGPSPHRVFLVFSSEIGGQAVEDGSYEHRVQTFSNGFANAEDRHLISRDPSSGRWFIPLDEVFRSGEAAPSPLDEQLLLLQFELSDGSHPNFVIRFAVNPPLPETSAVMISEEPIGALTPSGAPSSSTPISQVFRSGNSQGWLIASEDYVNPTGRSLTLWFRMTALQYEVQAELRLHYLWRNLGPTPPQGPPEYGESRAFQGPLSQALLQILRSGQAAGVSIHLEPGQWVAQSLKPGEKIQVQWLAAAPEGAPGCPDAFGAPPTDYWQCFNSLEASFQPTTCLPIVINLPPTPAMEFTVPTQWDWVNYQVSGSRARQVVLTEQNITVEDAGQEGVKETLLDEPGYETPPPARSLHLSGLKTVSCSSGP